ncbi:transmembrane amino acid transporter [Cystoisospora suis]|uniref:Transmembrane amino acid transporter n=1 Tax=Cystoisospora suis TaxID=483139 RepID=A0A2C6KWR0_9APIC|nr:transmembrane amino acid transporter [Cystoisospora suis]
MVTFAVEDEGRSVKASLLSESSRSSATSSAFRRFSLFSPKSCSSCTDDVAVTSPSQSSWLPGLFGSRKIFRPNVFASIRHPKGEGDVAQIGGLSSTDGVLGSTKDSHSSASSTSTFARRWGMPLRVSLSADRSDIRSNAGNEGTGRNEETGRGRVWLLSWLGRKKETNEAGPVRPAAFERRRKRYRTVSWKYKKSIGMSASFVFVCNQILASGLTSMPVTLIEYGWLPPLLMNLLFCFLSSMCSLLLLHSVTLIENNQNFDERFEYSATLRHFLAPSSSGSSAASPLGRQGHSSSSLSLSRMSSSSPFKLLSCSTGFLDYVQHHAGPAPLLRRLLRSISRREAVSSVASSGGVPTPGKGCLKQGSKEKGKKGIKRENSSATIQDSVFPRSRSSASFSIDEQPKHETRKRDFLLSLLRGVSSLLSFRTWKVLVRQMSRFPSTCMRWFYTVATRAPPLLSPRFPRTLTMLLHLNTFLSTCSAALLVAYCIDCLLLRIFSGTLFLPLLPTHVVPFYSFAGAAEWLGATCALFIRPFLLVFGLLKTPSVFLIDNVMTPFLTTAWLGMSLDSLFSDISTSLGMEWWWRISSSYSQAFLRFILPGVFLPSPNSADAIDMFGQSTNSSSSVFPSLSPWTDVWEERTGAWNFADGVLSPFFSYVFSSSLFYWLSPMNVLSDLGVSGFLRNLFDSFVSGFKLETGQTFYSLSSLPFVFSLPSQHQIEEVFSGVCTPDCDGETGVSQLSLIPPAIASIFMSNSSGAGGEASFSTSPRISSNLLGGGGMLQTGPECLPCVGHMGITVGYVITAAICLHLAVSDLQDNMQLQFLSFGAIIAAVVQISGSAALTLFRIAPSSFSLVASSTPALASSLSMMPSTFAYKGDSTTSLSPGGVARGGGDLSGGEGLGVGMLQGGTKGTVAETLTGNPSSLHSFSSWPEAVVRGSGMGSLVSTFVDAYSFSNALPSWANEVKDDVPVTKTIFTSTMFSCATYFLFGFLCAAAFPAPSASSNVLAAMLPACTSLVAVVCICFFHVFALLPSIVTSQISCRYDLINMAICLDKQSAFFTASIMPWFLYWLLTFSPLFALPSSLLTLTTNVLLNFIAPALVFVYALHASSSYSGDCLEPGDSLLAVDDGADGSLNEGEGYGSYSSSDLSPTSSPTLSILKHPEKEGSLRVRQGSTAGTPPISLTSCSTDAGSSFSVCPSSSSSSTTTPLKSCLRIPGEASGLRSGTRKHTTLMNQRVDSSAKSSNLTAGNASPRRSSACCPGESSLLFPSGDHASGLDLDPSLLKRAYTHDVTGEGDKNSHLQGKKSAGAVSNSAGSGKGRVSGAVAGGGGARSREVQRQLHEWLQEYSRQMPDSEVAQLLQQQEKEEEEEQRRLRTEGEDETTELRKKQLGNEWLRRHALGDTAPGARRDGSVDARGENMKNEENQGMTERRQTEEGENEEATDRGQGHEEGGQRQAMGEENCQAGAADSGNGARLGESVEKAESGVEHTKEEGGWPTSEASVAWNGVDSEGGATPAVSLPVPGPRVTPSEEGEGLHENRIPRTEVKKQKSVVIAAEVEPDCSKGSEGEVASSFQRRLSRRMSMGFRGFLGPRTTVSADAGILPQTTVTPPPLASGGPEGSVNDTPCSPSEGRGRQAEENQEEVRQSREPSCGSDARGPSRGVEHASDSPPLAPGEIPVEFAAPSEAARFVRRKAKTSRIDPASAAMQVRRKAKQQEVECLAGVCGAGTNEHRREQSPDRMVSTHVSETEELREEERTQANLEADQQQPDEAGKSGVEDLRLAPGQRDGILEQTEEEESRTDYSSRQAEEQGGEVIGSESHREQRDQEDQGTLSAPKAGGDVQASAAVVTPLAPGEIPVEFASASEAGRFVRRKGKTSCIDPAALALKKMKEERERARRAREESEQAEKCSPVEHSIPEDQMKTVESGRSSIGGIQQGQEHRVQETEEEQLVCESTCTGAGGDRKHSAESPCSGWPSKEEHGENSQAGCFERVDAKQKDWKSTGDNGDPPTTRPLSFLQDRSFFSVRSSSPTTCDSAQSECGSSSSLSDRHPDMNSPGGSHTHFLPPPDTTTDLCSFSQSNILSGQTGSVHDNEAIEKCHVPSQESSSSTLQQDVSCDSLGGNEISPHKALGRPRTSIVPIDHVRRFLTQCRTSLSSPKVSAVFLTSIFSMALKRENQTKKGTGGAAEGRSPSGLSMDQASLKPRRPRVVAFPFLRIPEQKLVATYGLLLVICFCAFAALAEDAHEALEICAFYISMACMYLVTACFRVVIVGVFGGVWTAVCTIFTHAFTFAAPLYPPVRAGLSELYTVALSPALLAVTRVLKLQEAVEFSIEGGTWFFSLIAGNLRGTFLARLLGSVLRRLIGVWTAGSFLKGEGWVGGDTSSFGVGRSKSSISSSGVPDIGLYPALLQEEDRTCIPVGGGECGRAEVHKELRGAGGLDADDDDEGLWSFEAFFLTLVILVLSCVPLLYSVGAYRSRAERRRVGMQLRTGQTSKTLSPKVAIQASYLK